MKVLAVFITILMLITGVDLCGDFGSYKGKDSIEQSKSGDEKHADEIPCSPFCHCARCPFSILIPARLKVLSITFIIKEKFDTYSASYPEQVAFSIWQPPKII